ncbi:MAG: hypothetical protein E6940_12225 [Clostridium septicum]|uniref:hypothetical protein n=1 Tax=Clostridium septicum TaxID=1504 RepID=UPI0025859547|nr:hypothetical protein [Clostridium septicum]MDU1314810.1 hypothetical protein [Clostridium septicum]
MSTLTLAFIFYVFYLVTKLLLSFYVYKDAEDLQLNSKIWSTITMLFPNYIGFVFYLIIKTVKINKELNEKNSNISIKKFKKPILLITSILFLGTSYYFLGDYFSSTFSSKFNNYNEATILMENGWISSEIPNTATNIYEVHDLDTNIGNGVFNLSEKEAKEFFETLNPIEKNEVLKMKSIRKRWWNKKEIEKNIKNDKYLLGEKGNFLYAIDPNGTVYFWIK